MPDSKFLQCVRGLIAIRQMPKKKLARRCKVSKPYFSEMIHGERSMPEEVQTRLLKELNFEKEWEKLSAPANVNINHSE